MAKLASGWPHPLRLEKGSQEAVSPAEKGVVRKGGAGYHQKENKSVGKGAATLTHCWWGRMSVRPLWKTVRRLLKKFKNNHLVTQQFRFWKKARRKQETWIQKDTCAPMITTLLFAIAKIWKQPKCPSVDEWVKKMEYYSAINNNKGILSFLTDI